MTGIIMLIESMIYSLDHPEFWHEKLFLKLSTVNNKILTVNLEVMLWKNMKDTEHLLKDQIKPADLMVFRILVKKL